MKTLLAASLAATLYAIPLKAQTPWIHIEVEENDTDASHVKVNLPLSVVQIALEAAPDKIMKDGRIHIHDMDQHLDVEDLRRMWNELRSAPDSELVTIQEKDETISVRRQGDQFLVDVDHRNNKDTVRVQLPVAVVDALFSGEGQELNLRDAIEELKSLRGEIVRVDDGESKVRIWIDEKD
jgi:hypothetical protein